MPAPFFLITCEHSCHAIPAGLRPLFLGESRVLCSHLGWDEGAAPIANLVGKALRAPVLHGRYSRLVVDLNRTADHPQVFSAWTKQLADAARQELIRVIHDRHWNEVRGVIRRQIRAGRTVIHVGVHSFVPELNGIRRKTDIGLLFDPARSGEAKLSRRWKSALKEQLPLAIHFNLPYRGTGNGLVTAMRGEFSRGYLGFELEINQRLLPENTRAISAALAEAMIQP